jgi:hypothetical protein
MPNIISKLRTPLLILLSAGFIVCLTRFLFFKDAGYVNVICLFLCLCLLDAFKNFSFSRFLRDRLSGFASVKFIFLFFVFFNLAYCFNTTTILLGADGSWKWAINYIARDPRFIYGRDVFFTYGPLGYLFEGQQYAVHIAQKALFNAFSVFLLFSSLYLLLKQRLPSKNDLCLSAVLILPFLGFLHFEWLWNIDLSLLFFLIWRFKDKGRIFYFSAALAGLLSAFSLLLKFNTAALSACLFLALCLIFLISDRKKLPGYVLSFGAAYLSLTLANIAVFFKEFSYFFKWLEISAEIAAAYSSAMTAGVNCYQVIVAVTLIAAYLAIAFKELKRDQNSFAALFLFAAPLFFAFKHGFVRHAFIFFNVFPIITTLVFILAGEPLRVKYRRFFKISAAACCACAILIYGIHQNELFRNLFYNFRGFIELRQTVRNFEKNKAVFLKGAALDKEWNDVIGNSSIQTLPSELSYAAVNNWKGWQPNPLLQLYSAYSKKLDEKSSEAFSPQKAPDFIFFSYSAIDNRSVLLDTPAVWNTILPNYDIALFAPYGHLLLKKKSQYKNIALSRVSADIYKFGESIKIPQTNGYLFAKIKIKNKFLGRIIAMLFRGNPSDIYIEYANGDRQTFRIISDSLQTPILINYIPRNTRQFAALFLNYTDFAQYLANAGDYLTVKEIAFVNKLQRLYYKDDIEIEWYKYENRSL